MMKCNAGEIFFLRCYTSSNWCI